MNRIDRLAAILIQLQSRRLVKAQDIADKFSISLRTVYRDVRALEEAGVPVIGEAGTGYKLMEGYKLPPVMFNHDDGVPSFHHAMQLHHQHLHIGRMQAGGGLVEHVERVPGRVVLQLGRELDPLCFPS